MSRLFKREIAVSLSHPGTSFFGKTTITTRITALRVQFRVVKNLKADPNTCEITISNLSHDSRAEFQTKPLKIRLDGGYDGQLERLFSGDLRWSESRHDSVDWETKLIVADGERAHR